MSSERGVGRVCAAARGPVSWPPVQGAALAVPGRGHSCPWNGSRQQRTRILPSGAMASPSLGSEQVWGSLQGLGVSLHLHRNPSAVGLPPVQPQPEAASVPSKPAQLNPVSDLGAAQYSHPQHGPRHPPSPGGREQDGHDPSVQRVWRRLAGEGGSPQ